MIPLRLTIKNFLSYGPQAQTINFEPYHLICLSGKNGHGKSALLDAITWSLWGQARKISSTAKADEGLLRLGQTTMMTSLDFTSNNTTYRVRREFSYTAGKAYTHLDFGIIDPENRFFKPLTDKTIRDTQDKIDAAVGLHYDSFINSVFLRQGHSNEFSKKSAKERKDILLTILGLTHYEKIRKRALEKMKALTQEKEHYAKMHEKLREELATKSAIQEQYTATHMAIQTLSSEEVTLHAKKEELETNLKTILEHQAALDRVTQHATETSEKYAQLITTFTETIATWRRTHAQQLHAQTVTAHDEERIEQEYTNIHQEQAALVSLKEQLFLLKEQEQKLLQQKNEEYAHTASTLQQACHLHEVAFHGLNTTRAQLEKELIALRGKQTICSQEAAQYAHAQDEQRTVALAQEVHEKLFERKKGFYHKFIAMGNALKEKLKDTNTKKTLTYDSTNPCCPLCEQNLSSSRKKFLHTKFVDQEQFINHQLARLARCIKDLKEQLITDHAHSESLKKQYATLGAQVTQHTHLVQEHTSITNAIASKEQEYAACNAAIHDEQELLYAQETLLKSHTEKHQLTTTAEIVSLRAEIITYETRIKEKQQLPEKLAALTKQRELLREYRTALAQVRTESILQQQRKDIVRTTRGELKELKKLQRELYAKQQQHSAIILRKQDIEQELTRIKQSLQELSQKKEALLLKQGSLEQQMHALEQKNTELQEQKTILAASAMHLFEYEAIENALSKDGIQALLIETALPEIEHEANYLLSKLTDNQAHLSLESLRDLKSGSTKETLDIKISDALGIRPYELFSGGEAFRIDFAIRIALSKLLARRAGTSLQTLIIDEGFGSQDEEGLAHIMDALYKIQDDFAKIIIVSHLPTMKDQFPVHFIVHKGPYGSSINVLEQD